MFFVRLDVKSMCVVFRTRHHVRLIFKWITSFSMMAHPIPNTSARESSITSCDVCG